MKRLIMLASLIVLGALSLMATQTPTPQAPQQQQPQVLEVEKVKDNLYILKGGGGNTAVFITNDGVVIVDTKLPGWGQLILDKIKSVTDKPVTMVINTHTHGD